MSCPRCLPPATTSTPSVHPLTLTGAGDRAHLAHSVLDLSAWVTDVVALIETEELDDVVLVGHSFSGTVITGVAERMPQRLARLVYLDAVLPADGVSVLESVGPAAAGYMEAAVAEHDGWSLPWFTDQRLDQLYGDHALSTEDLAWIRRHVTAQPIETYREALTIRSPAAAALPRTFVRCTANPSPPPVQRGTRGWDWGELNTGHWPMITAPQDTAALLDSIASSH